VSDLNLNVKIKFLSSPAPALATATVVRTSSRPSSGPPSEVEHPARSYAGTRVATRAPRTPPARTDAQRAGATPAGTGMHILILLSGGQVSEIQGFLAAFPDVAAVDVFDLQAGSPTLADLTPYDGLIVACNNAIPNAGLVGDVLADYADTGRSVVVTL